MLDVALLTVLLSPTDGLSSAIRSGSKELAAKNRAGYPIRQDRISEANGGSSPQSARGRKASRQTQVQHCQRDGARPCRCSRLKIIGFLCVRSLAYSPSRSIPIGTDVMNIAPCASSISCGANGPGTPSCGRHGRNPIVRHGGSTTDAPAQAASVHEWTDARKTRKSTTIVSLHKPRQNAVQAGRVFCMSARGRDIRSGPPRFGESKSLVAVLTENGDKFGGCSLPHLEPFLLLRQLVHSALFTTSLHKVFHVRSRKTLE